MTTPQERFRALRWARDWLSQVEMDPLVPADAKAVAAGISAAYPSDQRLRALIDGMALGISTDVAGSLIAASDWIHGFSHATSDPIGLSRVRRHLPKREDIGWNVRTREPAHLLLNWRALMGVHHWIQPDEDYADVVVIGWLEDCAVAVAAAAAEGRGPEELQDSRPRYLITSTTAGPNYEGLALGQRLRCTIPRPWTGVVEEVQICTHAMPLEADVLERQQADASLEGAANVSDAARRRR
jgi:hypothetical protein